MGRCVRTTLTLEKDVSATLERLRKTRDASMKALVNEALRKGLKQLDAPRRKQARFHTRSVNLGRCLVVNVDDVTEVLATAKGESFPVNLVSGRSPSLLPSRKA